MTAQPERPPLVSVIIPARNCAAQLRECLLSLRASDYPACEVIVVDDASTDDTSTVAEGLGARCLRLSQQGGPGAARNRGAEAAAGEILFFLDADVCAHPDTVSRAAAVFAGDPSVAAVFGSYDKCPPQSNLLSYYKNVYHHFVHQASAAEAWTFWSGCGAIRRSVFQEAGGFDPSYTRPCIEDIELGARLHRAGHRIILNKDIQATHLKKWTLWGMVKSDLFDRAIPWTCLLLRERSLPNDLNLRLSQRVCAVLALLLVIVWLVGAWFSPELLLLPPAMLICIHLLDVWSAHRPVPVLAAAALVLGAVAAAAWVGWSFGAWALIPLALILGIVLLNYRLYAFFAQERHAWFAAFVVPLQILYYLYSGGGFALGMVAHWWGVGAPQRMKELHPVKGAS